MGALTATESAWLADAAGRVADVLVENAIIVGGRATWLAANVTSDGAGVVHRTGDATLYDGTAGIAMASWPVAVALGREDLADIALGAVRHALSAVGRLGGVGLFDGIAGIGLAALEVGDAAGDERMRADGLDVLAHVADTPPSDVDLISGSAGVVLALLTAAGRTGSARWRAAAIWHGDHLLACAHRAPWGWSWPIPGFGPSGLCGLAHGAAGVAWALGELAAATGDARFLEGVDGARRFERSWFQPAENGWPDLRPESSAPGAPLLCPALWCHGATGIGLARLSLFARSEHGSLAGEASAALQAATSSASHDLRGLASPSLTICHGLGGTVLLLLAAHAVLREEAHLTAARWVASRALERSAHDPSSWPSGLPGGEFTPGLMTGLAGTMYALARAADPARTAAIAVLGDHEARGTSASVSPASRW